MHSSAGRRDRSRLRTPSVELARIAHREVNRLIELVDLAQTAGNSTATSRGAQRSAASQLTVRAGIFYLILYNTVPEVPSSRTRRAAAFEAQPSCLLNKRSLNPSLLIVQLPSGILRHPIYLTVVMETFMPQYPTTTQRCCLILRECLAIPDGAPLTNYAALVKMFVCFAVQFMS